jgi:hypothetical protein
MPQRRKTDMENLNRVIDWLASVARGEGDLAKRVDHLTRAFVDPRSYGGDADATQMLQRLLAGIRYIVFNIPAHLANEHERIFVAVLRPLDKARDYGWKTAATPLAQLTHSCEVHIIDDRAPQFARRLADEWRHVWDDYATLTNALQDKGILTWNQYLLHGCRNPKPFGLTWTAKPAKLGHPYYVQPSDDLLRQLGVPPRAGMDTRTWNRALRELPRQTTGWPQLPPGLTQRWEELEPREHVKQLAATAAASIFHLLRSYARWGGQAFLSIPVVIASQDSRPVSAALSICSDAPLTAVDLLQWRTLAASVLPLVASTELVTHFALERSRREAALRQAEAWAHEVKNRTGPIIRFLARAATRVPETTEDTIRALHGTLILNAASFAIQLALGRPRDLKRLARRNARAVVDAVLQYLLNYYAASSEDQLHWSPQRTTNESIDALVKLLSISTVGAPGERARKVLTHARVVWTIALLRELIQNIRTNSPPDDADRRIDITYSIEEIGDELVVQLEQRQRELIVEWKPEPVRGIQLTNDLFGVGGVGLGEIEVAFPVEEEIMPPVSGPVRSWDGVCVVIRSRARLALEG